LRTSRREREDRERQSQSDNAWPRSVTAPSAEYRTTP
jgi:hypothetical protein